MSGILSTTESLSLATISAACVAVLIRSWSDNGEPIYASVALSGVSFALAYAIIRWTGSAFMKAGLKGKDMSKKVSIEIPEMMGLVSALVYLLAVIVFLPFAFKRDILVATSGGGNKDSVVHVDQVETGRFLHRFPLEKLAPYGFAYGTIATVIILGIVDDCFDIRWRHKFFIPAFASLPTLGLYFVDFGVTHVVVPIPLRPYFGEMLDLGGFYYLYMSAISIFCPNSINIIAGVNGIEVAQSVVIAGLIVLNDILYLYPSTDPDHPATNAHLFSLYLLLPFIGVSLALLKHNWYPAKVFVGDTYCYFAGIIFATIGILGHFSKTLLLLFIPQIFNFIYSAPQLFHIVPCPRHRLPRFNVRTGLLEPSRAVFPPEKPLRPQVGEAMKILHKLHLLSVEVDETGRVVSSSNFTIINLWLVWRGPLREDRLTLELIGLQLVLGLLGLWVRHSLALVIFSQDNRFWRV
ncbi:UDP-N-acetylglucosamine:dolichyl phosphate N-acetylglucosamine-1-phosphate transferase-like protein [Myriangium duriaei CBS 260.36]|uniref:UDP-N-acetylglucosamine--dolichyl-phosphate N-acetylglucosaminephosphotransferase n=1 Tax=Myriangium duriaei CBS 260.36 TaxID=1168546 RepID=A0A9P4MG81_9PEZI|nr:UDP-N-acetylglucosamine:dolichyl phosphate N-acetylglucosamine-1-phosphate transferase-like protein [Myriangium duriaei CBS 260.36]